MVNVHFAKLRLSLCRLKKVSLAVPLSVSNTRSLQTHVGLSSGLRAVTCVICLAPFKLFS